MTQSIVLLKKIAMKEKNTFILQKTKIKFLLLGVLGIFFLTSACHLDQEDEKIANNKILLLKFNTHTKEFLAAKEFKYYNNEDNFTVNLNKKDIDNVLITDVTYVEKNALLFKATSKTDNGKIIIPEDFKIASQFERVLNDDLIFPSDSYKTLDNSELSELDFKEMWSNIQNILQVQMFLKSNPNQQIKTFMYQPHRQNNQISYNFFILKN